MRDEFCNELHLYYCDLSLCKLDFSAVSRILNSEDCQRFKNYKNDLRKWQFGFARYLIKHALHDIWGLPFNHQYQLKNYQYWSVEGNTQKFSVSISHSQNIVAIAIRQNSGFLGLDVEQRKQREYIELAQLFTTSNELENLNNSLDKNLSFYRLWTAKEAYIKAKQSSAIELSKTDLSECLLKNPVTINGYHYHQQTLADEDYYLSLISDIKFCDNIQSVTI